MSTPLPTPARRTLVVAAALFLVAAVLVVVAVVVSGDVVREAEARVLCEGSDDCSTAIQTQVFTECAVEGVDRVRVLVGNADGDQIGVELFDCN